MWTALDKRFVTRQKPAKNLSHSLLQGPTIERKSINSLFLFALDYDMAVNLQESNQEILGPLDQHTYQDSVVDRLEAKFNEK